MASPSRSAPPLTRLGALLLAVGAFSSPAVADDQSIQERMADIDARQTKQREALAGIAAIAEDRSGFMSATEAQKRYEDAVFSALMGDTERAALEFDVLIRSGAIASDTVRTDAEWYLGETLFELENHAIARDAYHDIVDQGEGHPFFAGAVRRLLELHGITGDSAAFYDLYNRYIATRRVAANPLINYTVAKSLYRQGDWARAKSLFLECCEESEYKAQAHYFVGTILVLQENLPDAAVEFRYVTEQPITNSEVREVVDLANLAYGRVQYELGAYDEATDAYLEVGRDSRYFADQLYELVWTFIKQGETAEGHNDRKAAYEEAIRAVEIFLLAFPEHRYAAQLKVVRGHLHMKQESYESANAAYERVITEYSPIRDLVAAVSVSREQPRLFFERLAEEDALERLDREGLPPFAAEMLYNREDLGAIVEMRRELETQRHELGESAEIAQELDAAFSSGLSSLGAFKNAYETLKWMRVDQVAIMSDLMALEEDYLLSNTTGPTQTRVRAIQQERQLVADVASADQRDDLANSERQQIQADQVRAVQSQAFLVEQVARELLTEAEATVEYLESGQHRVEPADVRHLMDELDRLQNGLRDSIAQLRPIQSEATLNRIVGLQDESDGAEVAAVDQSVKDNFSNVRRELAQYRSKVTAPGAYDLFSHIDTTWTDIERVSSRIDDIVVLLTRVEQEEIVRLEQEFVREANGLARLEAGVAEVWNETSELGVDATRTGFRDLTEFFNSSVMNADMGIVDVYWQRKVKVSEEIEDLNKERVELMDELDKRFEAIHAKLEE
jgi:TolA-binding protein